MSQFGVKLKIEIIQIGFVSKQNEIVHWRKYFPHGDSYK